MRNIIIVIFIFDAIVFVVFAIKFFVNGILQQQEYLRKNLLPVSERIIPALPLKISIPLAVSLLLMGILSCLFDVF
jgi:hypothetical protein